MEYNFNQPGGQPQQRVPPKKETPEMTGLINKINSLSRMLRILEERYTNVRRKGQVTEQNMLSAQQRINSEVKTLLSDTNELKQEIFGMKEKLDLFVKELENCAKKEDVKIVEAYVNLWNPVSFVTQGEAERIIKNQLEKRNV